MADAAVGFLLENLKQLLLYNGELLGDAKNQVEELHNDMILFKAFLRDSTERRSNNETLQALVDNIRVVVNKAEDVIDKFVVEKARYKAKNAFEKAINAIDHSVTIRNIAKEIESIRKYVRQIYEQKQFGFKDLQLEELPERNASEKKPPVVEEDNVIGFDEEAKTVIKRLGEEDQDLDVITIVGMAGLGKTTLARKLFNDQKVEYEFFTRAWAYVSQKYNRREVFLSILSSFAQTSDYINEREEVIAEELSKYLEKRRYLIVLDDVWTTQAWDDLKTAFPNNKKGSRILITSREKLVSRYVNPCKEPHYLKFLTLKESWDLLETKVFGKGKSAPDEVQKLGEEIAMRCKGLPLAIVVIAGILLSNRELSDWWMQVAENISSFIVTEQFVDVIALSYNNLPYHLKSCFLYLGVFPEDHAIPVSNVILLWIAEGFIEQNGERSLEDIAQACVEDLVNRNLLMVEEWRSNRQIKTCRVHDMLYEFCRKEALKQNFYQEIKSSAQLTLDNYRRVCIHSCVVEYFRSKPYGERVRSFLCFSPYEIAFPREHVSLIINAFELLRVLDIKSIILEIFPKNLHQLALLRYLALSCKIKALPSSFSKLWNMQTLILKTTFPTLELKEDIWKLYQLRHFRTNGSALLPRPPSSTPKGRENMQTLSTISPESCTQHVFARTPNIKELGVRGKLHVLFDNLFDNVGKLQHLTKLKLYNDALSRPLAEAKIVHLPPAYKFPTKLKKLTLSGTLLEWDQMNVVGNLEKLEVLKLKDNAFHGRVWEPRDGGFLSLKILHIGRTDLVAWKASKHHFPSLKSLFLQHCEKLEAVPAGLADVASFQVLALYRTPKAAASAREIRQSKNASGEFKLSIYPPDN